MNRLKSVLLMIIMSYGLIPSLAKANQQSTMTKADYDALVADFKIPAEENHLWCYWYWINDDISKDGITKDLAAMKSVGIGTALIGNINPEEKDGKVPLFSEHWWECMVHAVNEGKRLGVDIGTFNCPGWSQSGGPWVKPEMAMRYLTYAEQTVRGPGQISTTLPQPKEHFQDVCVLAFPAMKGLSSLHSNNTSLQVTPEVQDAMHWIDGNPETAALLKPSQKKYTLNFQSGSPITARSIVLHPTTIPLKAKCELYAVIDGKDRLLKTFVYDRSRNKVNVGPIPNGPVAIALPETKANAFKLVLTQINGRGAGFTGIEITERAVLEKYIEKQLGKMHPTPLPMWGSYLWKEQGGGQPASIRSLDTVIDISEKMDAEGRLLWQVPDGEWTVMRIGMTPTGTKNSPAAPQGKGFEIDKANEALIRYHFDQYVGKLQEKVPAQNRDALKYVVADSYEMGSQNWTDGFAQSFEKRYGYNPTKWLPVLSGVIVGSVTESERFLWDLRRAVADDVAYEYVGGLRKISNEHGLQIWLENYGHWGFPSEFLMYGGQSDLVAGEFWNEGTLGNIECKAASSCVHTYGKRRCFAEAFTSARQAYLRHPARLKTRGDWSFTEGVNQYVLHLYIQQPDDKRVPGMNAWFGTEFNRHNTWFTQSRHWMDYARRCQHLLQQGAYVADVCYFISENTPKMTGVRQPELPSGYSYDYINAEVIVRDMQVKDGRLVLPSGAAYRMMILPPLDTMRPAMIKKLAQLVKKGGVIYGPKPLRSPSMQNYPQCDLDVQKHAEKIWGQAYTSGILDRHCGRGRVFNDMDLQAVLDTLQVEPDFDLEHPDVLWTHRQLKGMDIYFLSNQSSKKIDIRPKFRVTGRQPQVWDAVSGEVRRLHAFEKSASGIRVPLLLEPAQSLFVVFCDQRNDEVHAGYTQNYPNRETLQTINSPWTVTFENPVIDVQKRMTFDRLWDWSQHPDETIKHYAGTAIYKTEFNLDRIPSKQDIFLNLGQVHVLAEVTINGHFVGGGWMDPYVFNVSNSLRKGRNTLTIKVVNLWRNHLVKDQALPEKDRHTSLVVSDVKPNEALQPSGLVGPVMLETIAR